MVHRVHCMTGRRITTNANFYQHYCYSRLDLFYWKDSIYLNEEHMKRADVLIKSYVEMLKLPYDDHWRLVNQKIYSNLRDIIAEDLKVDADIVHTICEAMARA